ncbi:hypothetical protein LEM8419_01953 [Neolewinella maritima]|uniref:3-keto-alpha-glucoside-1,2-lyase/3-keto-2-hydroxy-glucal hydratase domain-containing protein n=1 Tax=Neolewinella maritima TaxID=1383882 RepID=A0ABM9B145_9BACT|nr:DUF1080 domain-containing protein [Neolewinella maritima]CAH1000924.1 hypothetical protein LEM8419_01953 [Neolewinella maritima]
MKLRLVTILYSTLLLLTACADRAVDRTTEVDETTADSTEVGEWITLFDGSSTDGWRGYKSDVLPPGWVARDGMLLFDTEVQLEQDYTGGRDVVYGAREFDNFELELDWKIPPGGNSGILYHAKEEGYDSPTVMAPEYQLIDDEGYAEIHDLTAYNSQFGAEHPEQLQDWQMTGADYAMHTADPTKKKLNPPGEWNSSRIVFTPERVEYWLNGELLLSFVPWSEDWEEKRNSGKWKDAPDYGKYRSGYIVLQDHGSPLWFRNIRIREL